MKLPDEPITMEAFLQMRDKFLDDETEAMGLEMCHKDCGGIIKLGKITLYNVNSDGSLSRNHLGRSHIDIPIPYCSKCTSPDCVGNYFSTVIKIKSDESAPTE